MKTKLPESITTIEDAKAFLTELNKNHEAYHPEDDATDIDWAAMDDDAQEPTAQECEKLNDLMCDIYNLKGNDGRHCGAMVFDPCGFLLWLDMPETIAKDAFNHDFPWDVEKINDHEVFVNGWKYQVDQSKEVCTKQPFENNDNK